MVAAVQITPKSERLFHMTELLDILNKYIWMSDFITLLVFAALALHQRQNSSSLMTQGLVVLMSGIIIRYTALVNSFVSPDTSQSVFILWCIGFAVFDCVVAFIFFKGFQYVRNRCNSAITASFVILAAIFMISLLTFQYGPLLFGIDGPSYKLWTLIAFDLGIAAFEVFVIYAIRQAHLVSKKPYSLIARMYILAFFVSINIHIFTFLELYFWETHNLASVYKWGFASINISTTTVAFVITLLAIFHHFSKKNREGMLWQL